MNNLVQKLMLGCSATAMFTLFSHGVYAQPAPSETNVESVTVSGSRITISGYQAPTPVTVVDLEKLDSNAYANITDDVRQLPQVYSPPASFGVSQGAASPGTAGASLLNLRNLGLHRTLVLFDGQRVVSSDLAAGVVKFVIVMSFTGFKGAILGGDTSSGVRALSAQGFWGQNFDGDRGHIE